MNTVTPAEKNTFLKEAIARKGAYAEFLALREDIHKHKWFRSQEAKKDIGFDAALVDWTQKHGKEWHEKLHKEKSSK
jgi:hypothetical protein